MTQHTGSDPEPDAGRRPYRYAWGLNQWRAQQAARAQVAQERAREPRSPQRTVTDPAVPWREGEVVRVVTLGQAPQPAPPAGGARRDILKGLPPALSAKYWAGDKAAIREVSERYAAQHPDRQGA
jgi:hypothetical protein